MPTSRFKSSQIKPEESTQQYGYIWIPGQTMGPEDLAMTDEIGEFPGANCASGEVITYILPIPWDMDVTVAFTLQDYLIFDGVSDNDTFEIDHLYTIVETDATTDPVHVVPATAFTSEAAVLTIVAATHESRIYTPGVATLAADSITAAQQTDGDLLLLGWSVTLATMTEDQFIIMGSRMRYTRRFV